MKLKNLTKIILIVFILVYPLIDSFLGVDLGDSGYHVYHSLHIFENPGHMSLSTVLTDIVGNLWFRIFGFLGVWSLNLLEVLVEYAMAFISYRILKRYLGEIPTLVGLALAMVMVRTYLNVFNYHQFHVFWLILAFSSMIKSLETDEVRFSALSGCFIALDTASRLPGITGLIIFIFYIIWGLMRDHKTSFKSWLSHIAYFFIGFLGTISIVAILLYLLGLGDAYLSSVFRLGKVASGDSSSYSSSNLLTTLIKSNTEAIAFGFAYLGSCALFLMAGLMLFSKYSRTIYRKIFYGILAVCFIIAGFFVWYIIFRIKPLPSWPQASITYWFITGTYYSVTVVIIGLLALNDRSNNKDKDMLIIIGLMGILLPVLTVTGSIMGIKHTVLAHWFIAPLTIYTFSRLVIILNDKYKKKENALVTSNGTSKAIVLFIVLITGTFGYRFVEMAYRVTNFDSPNRFQLSASIDSKEMKFLKTTPRQAQAVNGVIDSFRDIKEDNSLVVVGGSLMMYTILDKEAYEIMWPVSSSTSPQTLNEIFIEPNIDTADLPDIIYCRTDQNFGFYESNYKALQNSMKRIMRTSRYMIMNEFIYKYDYKVTYLNDYYLVLEPKDRLSKPEVVDVRDFVPEPKVKKNDKY